MSVTSSHHVPRSISESSFRNFTHKEALHSGRVCNSILITYPRMVDMSQFIVLKIIFISVLQRAEYCIWEGLLLLNIYSRC